MPGRRTRILLCSLWASLLVATAGGAASAAPGGTPHTGMAAGPDGGGADRLPHPVIRQGLGLRRRDLHSRLRGLRLVPGRPAFDRPGRAAAEQRRPPVLLHEHAVDPGRDFDVPWWYRSDFTLGAETGLRTFLDISGVMSSADVWVNGTRWPRPPRSPAPTPGTSATSPRWSTRRELGGLRVNANDPDNDLTIGWIDWVQARATTTWASSATCSSAGAARWHWPTPT